MQSELIETLSNKLYIAQEALKQIRAKADIESDEDGPLVFAYNVSDDALNKISELSKGKMKAKHNNPDGFVPTFKKGDKVKSTNTQAIYTCERDSWMEGRAEFVTLKSQEGEVIESYCTDFQKAFVPMLRKGDTARSKATGRTDICHEDSFMKDGHEFVKLKGNRGVSLSVDVFEKVVEPAPMPTPMFTSSDTHDVKTECGKVAIDPKMPHYDKAAKDFKEKTTMPDKADLLELVSTAQCELSELKATVLELESILTKQAIDLVLHSVPVCANCVGPLPIEREIKEVLPPAMPKLKPLVWENGKVFCEALQTTIEIVPRIEGNSSFNGEVIVYDTFRNGNLLLEGSKDISFVRKWVEGYRNREILKHFE